MNHIGGLVQEKLSFLFAKHHRNRRSSEYITQTKDLFARLSRRFDDAIVKLRNKLSLKATVVSVCKRARACIKCENSTRFRMSLP